MSNDNSPAAEATRQARAWLEQNPLFLDTQTTGLDLGAQLCELAVIAADGAPRLTTLVRPTIHIPAQATAVHGLTDDDVAAAPSFVQVLPQLRDLLAHRLVVIYNSDYDLRLLRQSARAHGVAFDPWLFTPACAMELYAAFFGDWNRQRAAYRWQKLDQAACQCSLALPPDLHRAHADAELCRLIVRHMAVPDPDGRAARPLPGDPT